MTEDIIEELQEILDRDNDTLNAETFYLNIKNSSGFSNEKIAEIFNINIELVNQIRI